MPVDAAPALLEWYDRHARVLPWRARAGELAPDPYRVWLSEIMLQQTSVAAAKPYFAAFTARWPTVAALAAADEGAVMAAWAGLGYYARARNLIAAARAVTAAGGAFPDTLVGLRALPGIGKYTAAAIGAIAFGIETVVIDANVERVVARLAAIETPLPAARPMIARAAAALWPANRSGDFAQALMDLGSGICTPRSPACAICPLLGGCAAAASGAPQDYPRRAPKMPKTLRHGTAFWLERDGAVLLVRRPAKGLLGGMRALPSGPWLADDPGHAEAPLNAKWREIGQIAHVFTHFALDLAVAAATTRADLAGEWWPIDRLAEAGLPTVFAKAAALGAAWRERGGPGADGG